MDHIMPFSVTFAGPDTRVAECDDGPHRNFAAARAAAIEHIEEVRAGCEAVLIELKRAGSYLEYQWLRVEREESMSGPAFGVAGSCSPPRPRPDP